MSNRPPLDEESFLSKQFLQKTGRSSLGRNGTSQFCPHELHVARCNTSLPPGPTWPRAGLSSHRFGPPKDDRPEGRSPNEGLSPKLRGPREPNLPAPRSPNLPVFLKSLIVLLRSYLVVLDESIPKDIKKQVFWHFVNGWLSRYAKRAAPPHNLPSDSVRKGRFQALASSSG